MMGCNKLPVRPSKMPQSGPAALDACVVAIQKMDDKVSVEATDDEDDELLGSILLSFCSLPLKLSGSNEDTSSLASLG